MSEPIDIVRLVRDMPARARGRACIVLTRDIVGQAEWAARLAAQTDSEHLDLLDHFAQDQTLASKIAQFSEPYLFNFLRNCSPAPVLIVSGIEFLTATWAGQKSAMERFAGRVETWNGKPCLLFVLQHNRAIATRTFGRHRQHTFVVDRADTLQL